MKQHTSEELRNMSIKSIIQYFKDLHEQNRRANQNLQAFSMEVIMNEELIKRKNELTKTIQILEWDEKLKQINPAKSFQLKEFKNELASINVKLYPEEIKENEQPL